MMVFAKLSDVALKRSTFFFPENFKLGVMNVFRQIVGWHVCNFWQCHILHPKTNNYIIKHYDYYYTQ